MPRPRKDPIEARKVHVTISLTTREKKLLFEYAKSQKTSASDALVTAVIGARGSYESMNLNSLTFKFGVALNDLENKISSISSNELTAIYELHEMKARVDGFYSQVETIYDSLKAIPQIRLEEV